MKLCGHINDFSINMKKKHDEFEYNLKNRTILDLEVLLDRANIVSLGVTSRGV